MSRATTLAALAVAAAASLVGCTPNKPSSPEGTVVLREEGSPFIAFDVWIKAGSQDDPDGKEGLASLTAAVLADGSTQEHSYTEILELLYPMATSYTATVDKEMTNFRGVVHRDNLDAYYSLLRGALLEPAFRQEDFDRVKAQRLNFLERNRRFARDEELSKELLFWRAYRGTPYEHPEEGYVASVRSITLDDVKAFYAQHYLRNNVIVGVGGGLPEDLASRARADFDALPEGDVTMVAPPQAAMPDGIQVVIVEKQTDATAISIGYPLDVVRSDGDFWPLFLTSTWLGDHRNSFGELYQVIREQRGMNYGDYAYVEAFPLGYTTQERPVNVSRRSQLFEMWIRPVSLTAPGNLHQRALFATRAAIGELRKLADGGLPPDQVERTKNYLDNYSVTFGSTVGRRLAYAIDDAFYGMPAPGYLESIAPHIEALDSETVNAAIHRHLQGQNLYIVFITQDAEGLKARLLSGKSEPITYPNQQSPEILDADREITSVPLDVKEDAIEIYAIGEVFEDGN